MAAGRPSVRYQVLTAAVTALMITSLVASLAGFWRMEFSALTLLVMGLGGAVFGWLSWRQPVAAMALLLAVGAGLVAGANLLPPVTGYLQGLARDWAELWAQLRALHLEATFSYRLGTLFLALTALVAGVLILAEALSRGHAFWSLIGGMLVFDIQWAWFYDRSEGYFMTYAFLGFVLWTLGQAARRDAHWLRSGRKVGFPSHVATPLAGILMVAIVAAMLPTQFRPMGLGAFGEQLQEAFPVLRKLRGAGVGGLSRRFSLRYTGFSPTFGALGGPVELDHRVALYLKPSEPLARTAYLRGATYNTYDGQTWQAEGAEYEDLPEDGNIPRLLSPGALTDYGIFEITPAIPMGRTVFNVLETYRVEGLEGTYRFDQDRNLWAERAIAKGHPYEVFAREVRYSAEHIRRLSTARAGEEFAPYLQVPRALPERVGDLARRVTAEYEHPFDKAVALERYLAAMRYDLDTPAAPPGRDFVDFFLFDLQQGYCVYYATAMTVMLRELGIPARYVEGFAVSPSADYTEDDSGERVYSVLNSQAHAWVEAYFPGYGWLTFDPTPRADLPGIDRSAPPPAETDESEAVFNESSSDAPGPDNKGLLEVLEEDFGRGSGAGTPVQREWPWLLTALLALGVVLFLAYRRLLAQERIVTREAQVVVQEAWAKADSLLAHFGMGRSPSQTPREFAEALSRRWPSLKETAVAVSEDYTAARYGPPDREWDPATGQRARTYWEKVQELLMGRFGWRSYLWRRLRWKGESR